MKIKDHHWGLCLILALISSCSAFRHNENAANNELRSYRLICWKENSEPEDVRVILSRLGYRLQSLDLMDNGLSQRLNALFACDVTLNEGRVSVLERRLAESGIHVQHLAAIP